MLLCVFLCMRVCACIQTLWSPCVQQLEMDRTRPSCYVESIITPALFEAAEASRMCRGWSISVVRPILEYACMCGTLDQTWSSRDLSLGLETSRDVSRLLETRYVSRPVFTSLGLGLGLEPRSLGLGLGLGTSESWSRSWSWDLGPWSLRDSWSVKLRQNRKSVAYRRKSLR